MRLSKTFSMAVDKVGHAFKKAYQVIRPRTTGIILDIAIYCLPVYALTWYFDLLEGLSLRIFMSLLVAMAPASELLSDPRPLKSRGDLLVFALFIVPAFLLVTSQKFDWHILGLNAALGLAVFPWILLVWWLLGRNWLLATGLILALAVMTIYWAAALIKTDESLALLLLPVPTVMLGGVFWALPARWILRLAQRSKDRRMRGPGTQALAMATMFFPVMLVAVVVPGMLELSPVWSAVSLTIAGVLLSAVIAQPLRDFLLEWGNLSQNLCNDSKGRQGQDELC
jgi:hypothetical protein